MAASTSTAFAIGEAKAQGEPLPEPPQSLTDSALAFWPAIIASKRRTAWTESDLVQACQLARDFVAVEELSGELEREGHVLTAPSGRKYPNPAANLLDQAQRRIIATARSIQIHAIATTGKTDHQGNKNESARDLAKKVNGAHDLIASPLQ